MRQQRTDRRPCKTEQCGRRHLRHDTRPPRGLLYRLVLAGAAAHRTNLRAVLLEHLGEKQLRAWVTGKETAVPI
eukprot:scaffold13891_cov60-Phaeocystis_antarctica.AAC.3